MEEQIVTIDKHELQLLSAFHPEFCKAYRQVGYAFVYIDDDMPPLSDKSCQFYITVRVRTDYNYYARIRRKHLHEIEMEHNSSLLERMNMFVSRHYYKKKNYYASTINN